ncbi:phosphodiester glycosidase family protein [Paenibacillus turpanensis]|uniref:phosphodiester glycosidase family protein n=1 Tax=Paenibacillus turpanensis TaxID=2689078 RepID=UPI00140CFE13|nr:phosphodiester glycosidase family protein [Paenibacillus turpanensis]
MNTAYQWIAETGRELRGWSWLKKLLLSGAILSAATSSFLYLTPPGETIREFLAETVMTTRHRSWAWVLVGTEKRDYMVRKMQQQTDEYGKEKQNLNLITTTKQIACEPLVELEDISGTLWKGKLMKVCDPRAIRVVVPNKPGEGERISSMVERTGAVAGFNGGGFVDPDGLGNGFAPIGIIMSGGEVLYNDHPEDSPQHVVGFTEDGTLVVGKYSLREMKEMKMREAVMFYPRFIANGKPLITSGDGGWGRAPRTAVGQTADGTVFVAVIDGRQTHSVGATLKEVQDLFLERGVVNAGFLDGGASSELVYEGELVTKPSSRWGERRLPSGMLVFDNPDDIQVDNVWEGISEIDPGGAYDHPDFLREQSQKKSSGSSSGSTTKKPASESTPAGSAGETNGTGNAPKQNTEQPKPNGNEESGNTSGGTNWLGIDESKGTGSPGNPDASNNAPPAATTPPAGDPAAGSNGGSSPSVPAPAPTAPGPTQQKPETAPEGGAGTTGSGSTGAGSSGGDAASPSQSGAQPTAPASSGGTSSGGGTTSGAGTSTSPAAGATGAAGPSGSGGSTSGTAPATNAGTTAPAGGTSS